MMALILESAARTLLLAAAVWLALRIFRVTHVVGQKIAWTLVLAAAIAMPFLMRWHWIQLRSFDIPASAIPSSVIPSSLMRDSAILHAVIRDSVIRDSGTAPVSHAAPAAPHATPVVALQPAKQPGTTSESLAPAPPEIAPAVLSSSAPLRHWTLPDLRTLAVQVYFLIAGFLLFRLFLGLALAWRIWLRAEPASALVEPRAEVRLSSDIGTPVTIGHGIVLPASFVDWNRPRLRIVLAHELAHVRQRDFYLQLLASLYTAIFWFSPAAWWIQKSLSDLGEAISDFAGITEAKDAPSYAELLLEVAALPRHPVFAVRMARSRRIEHRIDRLLVDRLFRRSFVEGRKRALAAAAVIPIALAVSTSIVAVHAAEKIAPVKTATIGASMIHVVAQDAETSLSIPEAPAVAPQLPATPLPNVKLAPLDTSEPVPAVSPVAAVSPAPAVSPVPAVSPIPRPQANPQSVTVDEDSDGNWDSDRDSFMLVTGNQTHMFNYGGDLNHADAVRSKLHGDYILTVRDGKYYVIDDPAIVDQSRKLIAPIEELGRRQEVLGAQQEKLGEQQEVLGKQQEEAHIATPDMSKEIAQLQAAVKKLQDLQQSKNVTQEQLADVQSQIGGIEGKLGSMQGEIGAQEGELGRQQGELGRQQGELGRQQGDLGRQQGRLARQASRQMKTMIDQAFQSGKARPVS